ncbi:MAG: thiazole synthase [Gammaproteobacteria bacterium]
MSGLPLTIAGREFSSRLLVGTGKYADFAETRRAVSASGAEIVTVAVRRTNIGQEKNEPSILESLPPGTTVLPNTAGCYDAAAAVRVLKLARDLLDGENFAKLEVLGDKKTLYPDVAQTLAAARELVADGFAVLAYTSDDPVVARELENIGCAAVMPLASLIGSGMGIVNPHNLRIIIENANIPVIVDAGVGAPSDAAMAMEMGCDGVLTNTAIARAKNPERMAAAMRQAVIAGREGFCAGLMQKQNAARPSSPDAGIVGE